jgi:hypothetical protein
MCVRTIGEPTVSMLVRANSDCWSNVNSNQSLNFPVMSEKNTIVVLVAVDVENFEINMTGTSINENIDDKR